MAENTIVKYLRDILGSIEQIESYFNLFPRRFDTYCSTPVLQRAIQMNIAIIGEAMNKLLKTNPEINITKARKIVDTRNYVIHGYDSVSNEMIWSIVINHLPLLKAEITKIITNIDNKTEQNS
ncbi:MAG: DUF86 domain-containing protein [Muribaculaceae bacterium]|nr:DUF86 domain-containing protein [Muribaculaceae bacterium]